MFSLSFESALSVRRLFDDVASTVSIFLFRRYLQTENHDMASIASFSEERNVVFGLPPSVQLSYMLLKKRPPSKGFTTKPAARASSARYGGAERLSPTFGTSKSDQTAQRSFTFQ